MMTSLGIRGDRHDVVHFHDLTVPGVAHQTRQSITEEVVDAHHFWSSGASQHVSGELSTLCAEAALTLAHPNQAVRVDLDAETARKMAQQGGALLFLDVPPGTWFGMDQQAFVVGPRFRGMKMIPPGPHFVYHRAASRHGADVAPVIGFFVHLARAQVLVRRWNPQEERLVALHDSAEEERYVLGVRNFDFDSFLGPYDVDHFGTWQRLSLFITAAVIQRLEPVGGDITLMAEKAMVDAGPATKHEKLLDEHLQRGREILDQAVQLTEDTQGDGTAIIENHHSSAGVCQPTIAGESAARGRAPRGCCFYTVLPRLVKRPGLSAAELTASNLDKVEKYIMLASLDLSVSRWANPFTPLGSGRVCFIFFVTVVTRTALGGGEEAGFSLDEAELGQDMFLYGLFKDFFAVLGEARQIDGELHSQAKRLRQLLEDKLGWNLEVQELELQQLLDVVDSDDEYAPVVVAEDEAIVQKS
eukprot:SM000063S19983  [mRNA]  locus=s63:62598:66984:- [translate_table: standard]